MYAELREMAMTRSVFRRDVSHDTSHTPSVVKYANIQSQIWRPQWLRGCRCSVGGQPCMLGVDCWVCSVSFCSTEVEKNEQIEKQIME